MQTKKEMRCKKCHSTLVYTRLKTKEIVCRKCGYIQDLKGGKKMKKQLLAIPVLMLFMASVLAFDIDATRWSIRGDVALADVDNYFGQTLTSVGSAQSSVNAYINLQRGISGSGYIVVQGKNSLDENVRLSVNWNSRGNNYGFTSVEDTPTNTIIYANARVIRNGQTTYGVPIVIKYFKNTGEFVVQGSNFRLSPIVTNLS